MKTILAVLTILCLPALVFAGNGKTIKNEVRNSSGKLVMKSRTLSNGTTETRSPSGKLLFKSK